MFSEITQEELAKTKKLAEGQNATVEEIIKKKFIEILKQNHKK